MGLVAEGGFYILYIIAAAILAYSSMGLRGNYILFVIKATPYLIMRN